MGKILTKKQMLKEQEKLRKDKRLLEENPYTGEYVVKNTIIILLSTILFIGICYLVINIAKGNINLFTKENKKVLDTVENGVICGTLFGKEDSEYYVLAYDLSDENEKSIYESVKASVDSTEKKIYTLDLSSGLNKTCVGEKNVINNDISKLKLAEPTLLVISGSKITKNITTLDKIRDYLSK